MLAFALRFQIARFQVIKFKVHTWSAHLMAFHTTYQWNLHYTLKITGKDPIFFRAKDVCYFNSHKLYFALCQHIPVQMHMLAQYDVEDFGFVCSSIWKFELPAHLINMVETYLIPVWHIKGCILQSFKEGMLRISYKLCSFLLYFL